MPSGMNCNNIRTRQCTRCLADDRKLCSPRLNPPISKVRGKPVAKTNFPTNFQNRNPKRETVIPWMTEKLHLQHAIRTLDKISTLFHSMRARMCMVCFFFDIFIRHKFVYFLNLNYNARYRQHNAYIVFSI